MFGVTVRIQTAGIRDGDMTEQKYGLNILGIGLVIGFDESFNLRGSLVAADIMAQNDPAIANEILLQTGQPGLQIGGVSIVDDQDKLSTRFNQGQINAGIDVSGPAKIRQGIFQDAIFVSFTNADVRIGVGGGAGWQSRERTPGGRFLGLAREGVTDPVISGVPLK